MQMSEQPHDHIVRGLDEEQQRLVGELLRMGEIAAAQLEASLDVVQRRRNGLTGLPRRRLPASRSSP